MTSLRRSTVTAGAPGASVLLRVAAAASLAALTALGAPRVAAAQEAKLPVAVLSLQTEDAFDQAEALTKALKRVVAETPGWSHVDNDWAVQVLVLSLECVEPPDAACEEKIAAEIKGDRFVWGTMKLEGGQVAVELHLWQRGAGRRSTTAKYSTNLTEAFDDSLLAIARKAFLDLAGPPPGGRVQVQAAGVSGSVYLDGQLLGTIRGGKASFDVPIGSHKLRVEAEGYEPMEALFDVQARQERSVTLVPVRITEGFDFKIVGGFAALAAGAGFGVAGLVSSLQVSSIQSDFEGDDPEMARYLTQVPTGTDPCEYRFLGNTPAAARGCSEAKDAELMQAVFYPLAGVSLAVGTVLLLASDWTPGDPVALETGWTIEPRVGPQGGDVAVTLRF
jgi:hypothetical protein